MIENPSFEVNNALLSRCRVFVMKKLDPLHIKRILTSAVDKYNSESKVKIRIEDDVVDLLSQLADGDARVALNIIDSKHFHNIRKLF
jgi:putative ATPase